MNAIRNATFAQIFCLLLSLVCLGVLILMFLFVIFNPKIVESPSVAAIVVGMISTVSVAFASLYKFIVGSTAGSQAKDEIANANSSKMIEALANSTPIPNVN